MDSLTEKVFYVVEDQCSMVDGIDLYTKKLSRHGPCHASREVVHIELDFHFELSSFVLLSLAVLRSKFAYRGDELEL